ncbi:MAG: hypothetical protein LBP23_01980 [Treponema sp.]|nr:hypothetical protein [Treponema sp.]
MSRLLEKPSKNLVFQEYFTKLTGFWEMFGVIPILTALKFPCGGGTFEYFPFLRSGSGGGLDREKVERAVHRRVILTHNLANFVLPGHNGTHCQKKKLFLKESFPFWNTASFALFVIPYNTRNYTNDNFSLFYHKFQSLGMVLACLLLNKNISGGIHDREER